MIYGDRQFRDVKIMTAANTAARANKAALAEGEVQAFNVSGLDLAAAGEPFVIATKRGGEIILSDVIDPANVLKASLTPYAADANKIAQVVIPASPTVGDSYEARILIRDWGMTSALDYVSIYGQYVVATGDTADDVAAGLAAALNKSIAVTPTAKVTASSSTSALIVTGANNDYKQFQFDGKPSDFVLSLVNPVAIGETVNTARKDGKGEGYDIAALEYFANLVKGDKYANSEISYSRDLYADAAATYDVLEISYYSERLSAPGDKQRKVLTIPVLASLTAANVNAQLVDPLQTIGLSGLVDLA